MALTSSPPLLLLPLIGQLLLLPLIARVSRLSSRLAHKKRPGAPLPLYRPRACRRQTPPRPPGMAASGGLEHQDGVVERVKVARRVALAEVGQARHPEYAETSRADETTA